MILHSVTMCSLILYYHPHYIAFCLYNVFTYFILPSTWYCILFVQHVHLFHITIHMILHSVCTSVHIVHITIHMILHSVCMRSLIPYYHPHDIAFCLYNMFTYSILPSTWYCILFVRVHLSHITIHKILHSVTTCSLILYYHPHDIAFCLYNVFTYSILPSTWYCILFVQHVHLFHITIHTILHSVCTRCSRSPHYHPHDIAFCLYAFNYSILPSTWYCILFVQRVHLFHITIHMILHSVCTTCSLISYYHPHDIAFCLYNVNTYSILPSTWYCILCVQRVHLFHITIHMIVHSVCTMCSLIPYYHPHDIAFCYNVFTYSILPSTLYCILLVQRVHLFHITIHMILHSVCTTCSLIPYYHPHDIAFCLYKCSHSPHYHPHDSAFCLYDVFAYSILPSTWYCILLQCVHLFYITIHIILHSACTTCSLISYYHPHDIAFCLYNMFTYSILPSTWYCILLVQRVLLFHITIHMILHSVCTTCSLIPYYHPHDIAFCYNVFAYSILPSTWYFILFVQRVHLFHITIHMILHSVTTCSLIPYYHPHDITFCLYNMFTYSILPSTWYCILFVQRVHLFHITIHMILHSVCTTSSLIPYYHPHYIAFCLYNVFAYFILPSTWYCILFVQHVHLFHITIHMILHSVCTSVHIVHITIHMILHSVCTRSLIPYYHPHDIAFCLYNMFTYSILPSTWYCILFVQRVHLSHITIHKILHSVTSCSLILYYHPHDIAFCLYNVFTYSILPSTWYCILFVQHVHLFHITIHMILHSVCTCSLIPYYHPHDIAFCVYNVFTYSILPSTWYCILFVQRVHLFHITIHMILHCVTTCSLIPYYRPHDIAFCLYNMFTYSILPSTWYCILFVQRVQLFHITIHMILHSVTTCSLIPYYHPHDISFCLYNVFTYSILPSTWYCILFVQHVHLFHITIHMILHSVCTTCSLIPYYHPQDIAFCYIMFTYSILPSTWYCILLVQRVHLFHITIHMILHSVCTTCSLIPYYHPHDIAFCLYVFTYSILPSTWYCILCVQRVHLFHITIHMILHSVCTTCSLIPYYHPHDIALCYNVFTYSLLPSTRYCILFVQHVHLFHITIHMILHSVCTTCSIIPYYHPHDIAFCYNVFAYSILPSTWYFILFVQRVHLFHITIHMILHSVCTTCSLIPYYHPHDIAFCLYNVFTYPILPSTRYCILLHHVHLFYITIHMILHSACTTCSLIPYYHPHDIAFCLYNMFTYSILPSTWYCILFVRVHLFHITIHMILHSVCTTCSLIPYYHPHDIAFCYNVFTYSLLPSTWYYILFVQHVHLFHITIHMILHSVCTTCSLIPYYHPHDIAFCVYNVFTYSILPSTW